MAFFLVIATTEEKTVKEQLYLNLKYYERIKKVASSITLTGDRELGHRVVKKRKKFGPAVYCSALGIPLTHKRNIMLN